MGKFDRRDRMPGQGHAANSIISRPGLSTKKATPYFADPFIIPRVNQYLADNKDKMYVDINDMVSDLQRRHREYGRRKRGAFKQVVEKAFSVVLQQCGLNQGNLGQVRNISSDNSSSEVEECNISDDNQTEENANKQLVNLYKPNQLQAMAKQFQKCPNDNAELINLSSDDENLKDDDEEECGKSDGKQEGEARPKSNGIHNHVFKETTVTLVRGGSSKQGWKFPAKVPESPHVTITRKRRSCGQIKHQTGFIERKFGHSLVDKSSLTFADFAGNNKVLEEVCKLILHMQHPAVYGQLGVSAPRGLLLHGPPGCGKTLLASAIAGELQAYFIKVTGPELVGGVSGESEQRIRELFETAAECWPCVLFIDEIDAVSPSRQNAQREMERRIVAQLLSCMDDLSNKEGGDEVLVIGATNRPDALDPALRRAGRFDREVCLGIPDLKAREQILRITCANMRLIDDFNFEEVATNTPGFVGADLVALAREAAMHAINRVFASFQYMKRDKRKPKTKRLKLDEGVEDLEKGETSTMAADAKLTDDESIVVTDEAMEVDIIESKDLDDKEKKKESDNKRKEKNDSAETLVIDNKKDGKEEGKKDEDVEKTEEKDDIEEIINEDNEENKTETEKEEATMEGNKVEKETKENEEIPKKNDEESEKSSEKAKKGEKIKPGKENKSEGGKKKDTGGEKREEKDDKEDKTDNVDSDMEIAETGSEESAQCDKVQSDDESEVEVLPDTSATSEYAPPSLEILLSWLRDAPPLNPNQLRRVRISQHDFTRALKSVQPSAKREGFATVPDVTWDDVGSLKDIREELKMFILGPVKFRKQFENLGLVAPTGILLCGPPGCGKTLLAKAVANEAGINFISVKGPELLNMYVGESERAVRQCFQRARNSAPCVIFFDELDALCPRRSETGENGASMRVVNQMLTEMDGVEERREVFLMAATNRPDIVDPAVLRPGRLDKMVYVGLPNQEDRLDILRALTKNGSRPRLSEGTDLAMVASHARCDGYTGADLAALVREAALQALKQILSASTSSTTDMDKDAIVTQEHFERALHLIRPSVTLQEQKRYEELRKRFTAVAE